MWGSVDRPIKTALSPHSLCLPCRPRSGLRIKETKEVYEGEVTELTPCETENPMGGYGKTISHVIIGLKTGKGTKQLKVRLGASICPRQIFHLHTSHIMYTTN